MKMNCKSLVAAAAVTLLAMPLFAADVLEQVPSSALFIVKVNNLESVNAKAGALAEDFGIAAFQPAAADPLGSMFDNADDPAKAQAFKAAVNLQDDLAFAFFQPPEMAEDDLGDPMEKAFVVYIPVKDYQAFVTALDGKEGENGLNTWTSPEGEEVYLKKLGDFAAMSPSPELLNLAPEGGIKPTGLAAKELEEKDIVMWANIPQLGAMVQPELEDGRSEAMEEMKKEMDGQEKLAAFTPAAEAGLTQFFNVAEAFFRDTNASIISLKLSEQGIGVTAFSEFKEGSYLANTFGNVKNTEGSLIYDLPEASYLFYGGATVDSAAAGKLIDDLVGPIVAKLQGTDEGVVAVKEMYQTVRGSLDAYKSTSVGLLKPEGDVGQVSLVRMLSVTRGDAKKIMSTTKELSGMQQELMSVFELDQADAMMSSEIKEDAKQVDGVSFIAIRSGPSADAPAADRNQHQYVQTMVFGPVGGDQLMGMVSDDKVLAAVGVTDAELAKGVAAAKAGTKPFAENAALQLVRDNLPKSRVFEGYWNVGDTMDTGIKMTKNFFNTPQVQVQPNLPPVGWTVSTVGKTVRVDVFVPAKTVQQGISTAIQVQAAMQGGGGGGL